MKKASTYRLVHLGAGKYVPLGDLTEVDLVALRAELAREAAARHESIDPHRDYMGELQDHLATILQACRGIAKDDFSALAIVAVPRDLREMAAMQELDKHLDQVTREMLDAGEIELFTADDGEVRVRKPVAA